MRSRLLTVHYVLQQADAISMLPEFRDGLASDTTAQSWPVAEVIQPPQAAPSLSQQLAWDAAAVTAKSLGTRLPAHAPSMQYLLPAPRPHASYALNPSAQLSVSSADASQPFFQDPSLNTAIHLCEAPLQHRPHTAAFPDVLLPFRSNQKHAGSNGVMHHQPAAGNLAASHFAGYLSAYQPYGVSAHQDMYHQSPMQSALQAHRQLQQMQISAQHPLNAAWSAEHGKSSAMSPILACTCVSPSFHCLASSEACAPLCPI